MRLFRGREVFFLLMLLIFRPQAAAAQAQGGLQGFVADSLSRQPVGSATVSLTAKGRPAANTITDSNGLYHFTNLRAGIYSVNVRSVGYRPVTFSMVIGRGRIVQQAPAVRLTADYGKLSEVVVTGQKRLIENKIDRIVFNAENDLTSQGGVATDILKKIPQVSVDVDGNVELSGTGSIKFLINGKPSTAFGSNIADVLQSIPASQIRSVEVMTTPGARYDAEGLGGVINIILKNDPSRGINTTLSLTGGSRLENGNLNINLRTGKWGVHLFSGFNTRLPGTDRTTSRRTSTDSTGKETSLLTQSGAGRFTRFGSESGFGFDFSPDRKNSVSGSLNYNLFQNHNYGTIDQSQLASDSGATVSTNYRNATDSRFHFGGVDVNLNYKHLFAKPDRELEFAINSSFGRNRNQTAFDQFTVPDNLYQSGNENRSRGKENETEINLDYSTPLTDKVSFGTGAKVSLRDISSDLDAYSKQSPAFAVPDTALSNRLEYHQKVYAAYGEITFPIGSFLGVKAGARYERTEIRGSYFSPALIPVVNGYNTIVPSVYFSHQLAEGQQIKAGYTRRIERPDFQDLNPFVNTSDPKNISKGNPTLLPQRGQRMELTYTRDFTKQGSLAFGFFYRSSTDDIQPYVVYYPFYQVGDSVYNNVSVRSPQNVGVEKNLGFNAYSDLTLWTKFTVRTDFTYFHRFISNKIDKGFNTESNNYRINLNLSYRFSGALSAEFFSNFRSARNEIQGRYPTFTSYSFAVRRQFWNRKGSLALTLINPFGTYLRQRTVLYGPGFQLESLRKIPFRSVGLNFTWRFGKLEFKKEAEHADAGGISEQ